MRANRNLIHLVAVEKQWFKREVVGAGSPYKTSEIEPFCAKSSPGAAEHPATERLG
jgi:hypothetical protein